MNKIIHPTTTKNRAKDPPSSSSSFAPPQADLDLTDQAGYPVTSAEKLEEIPAQTPASGSGSLISITQILYQIEVAMIDANGELSPELESKLSAATIAQEKKIDAYGIILDRLESVSLEYAKRGQRLMAVAKAADNIVNKLWGNIKYAMRLLDAKEFEGQDIRFSLSTGRKVEITDASMLPEKYLREVIKYEPNLVAIGADLKAGVLVPGAQLTESYTLRVGAPKKGLK